MDKAQRIQALSKLLAERGATHLNEVARHLGVSQMTVRRDLARHADTFTCLGGYVAWARQAASGYLFEFEKDHYAAAKKAACRAALRHLREQDTIFVDCGTTMLALAQLVPDDLNLTVICYSLAAAEILKRKPNVRLLLLGGWYMSSSDSFGGEEALAALADKGVNSAFISAGGVDREYGVSCWNPHEKAIKQQAMKVAAHSYLVADSSKFGQRRPICFARIESFDAVITEHDK